MGIEIKSNSGRPPQEAVEASKAQSTSTKDTQPRAAAGAKSTSSGADQLKLSNQAAQLKAMEAEIANLPVVDTQRVQDVQRTLATNTLQVEPAQVVHKLLTFEAGLGRA
jgi:negative regulator of flagellin synthesis FlgM